MNCTPGKGRHVRFYLKTRDVIHSFFLPNMRLKQDALPGKIIPVWFDTKGEKVEDNCRKSEGTGNWQLDEDKAKEAELACAELCGWRHYRCAGSFISTPHKDDYEAWLEARPRPRNAAHNRDTRQAARPLGGAVNSHAPPRGRRAKLFEDHA